MKLQINYIVKMIDKRILNHCSRRQPNTNIVTKRPHFFKMETL